jgi:hypothetical protein
MMLLRPELPEVEDTPVAAGEALITDQAGQVGLEVGQAQPGVGGDLVEVVQQRGLGQHGQFGQGTLLEPLVEPLVERRARGGVATQPGQLSLLMVLQLRSAPPLTAA